MLTDPIADFLTRLRNANTLGRDRVEAPFSSLKEAIAAVLEREGYIRKHRVIPRSGKKVIRVHLKSTPAGQNVITHLERVSKVGRRVYVQKDEIPRVLNGLGICILSSSKGVVSGAEAVKMGVGGELLCYIW